MLRPDPIRAVVFDFDGLLADTERPWQVAEEAMYSSRDVPFGDAERGQFLGMAVPKTAAVMADRFNQPQPEVLADLLARAGVELGRSSPPMPGAAALMQRLRAQLVPYAVASNTPRELLNVSLVGSGLAPLVDIAVAGDEVAQGKPEPDVYVKACRLLNVEPTEAVAIEDSPTGAASARAAGLWVAMIPSGAFEPSDADIFLTGLDDPQLLSWFG